MAVWWWFYKQSGAQRGLNFWKVSERDCGCGHFDVHRSLIVADHFTSVMPQGAKVIIRE